MSWRGKVFDRIIEMRIRKHVKYDDEQFGFQPNKSTMTFSYKVVSDPKLMGLGTIATFYDSETAFGSVDSTVILNSCIDNGMSGPLFTLMKSFLTNRKLKIKREYYHRRHFHTINSFAPGSSTVLFPSILSIKSFLQLENFKYKYADDSTTLSTAENLSLCSKELLDRNGGKTEHINFGDSSVNTIYKTVEKSIILGPWIDAKFSFISLESAFSVSLVIIWKETSTFITQGINLYYVARNFHVYVKHELHIECLHGFIRIKPR